MIKKYRIYIDTEKHKDIYEQLESVPRPLRGEYIRTAIRFFIHQGVSNKKEEHFNKKDFTDVFG